jgi:hypothetical protein
MYRQNKLKEELDNLRKENYSLRNEITFWKERCNTFYSEITALRFELQNRDLMGRLIMKDTLEPKIIKLDNDEKN